MEPQPSFDQIQLRQAIPGRFLLGIAKLRATRRLSARIAELWGASGSWLQTAYAPPRERTHRDPAVNILRNTASTFGGIVGGAAAIELSPHEKNNPHGRRLARNTQLILREEAQLDRVADPAGGSYAIEELTEQIAQKAWAHLQQIEANGGLLRALESGWIAAALQPYRDQLEKEVRTRARGIIGVSRFANLGEAPPHRELEWEPPTLLPRGCPDTSSFEQLITLAETQPVPALNRARLGKGISQLPQPLPKIQLGEPFERLRDRADRQPATVFLACLGPLPEHTARSSFGREFLESGGLKVHFCEQISSPEEVLSEWKSSGTSAVILSAMPGRSSEIEQTLRALTDAGAAVWCLGKHRDRAAEYTELGARGFIFSGVDAITLLTEIWESACPS